MHLFAIFGLGCFIVLNPDLAIPSKVGIFYFGRILGFDTQSLNPSFGKHTLLLLELTPAETELGEQAACELQ